jgi:hypothetical protein
MHRSRFANALASLALVTAACSNISPMGDSADNDGALEDVWREERPALDALEIETGTPDDGTSLIDASMVDATAFDVTTSDGATGCTETVSTASELQAAAQRLGPGRVLCLAPGRYVLTARISLGAQRSGSASSPAVIRARDGRGTVTVDGAMNEEAFFFSGATHVVIEGLLITGGQYHGVKLDPPSADIVVRDCEITDTFNGTDANAQLSPIKGFQVPRVLVERTRIRFSRRWIGNNIQGIDCNACPSWVVRDNEISDVRAREGGTSGTAIQFKSGSRDTVIERNVLHDSFIGVSFGGFGNPMGWSGQPWEHVGGVVRNNVIYRCEDAGITVISARDALIANNTLWSNGFTPDVRRMAMNVRYQNNILDRALNLRDGTMPGVMTSNNLVLPSPRDSALFVDVMRGDFHLVAAATTAIDRGAPLPSEVMDDIDQQSRPRGMAFDIGADER